VSTPVRIGVIGAGRIAQAAHLPAIEKASDVRLVAVSDPSPTLSSGVAARYGVAAFTDTARLLEQDLDAVVVATPDRLHLPLGLQAIAAGKHVLMEKPLASTVAEAEELAAAATAAGVRLQTGSMKRHDPGLQFAKAGIARIGPVLSMTSWYRVMSATRLGIQQTLFPEVIVDEQVRAAEGAFKADGQRYRLATHGAHLFDGLRYVVGDLDWLSARSATIAGDISWHGTAGIAASGGLASFEISVAVHSPWAEGVDVFGERGHVKVRSPYVFSKLGSAAEVFLESEGVAERPVFADTNPFTRQVQAFARAILDGTETDPTPQDGIEAVRLIQAAADSSAADGAVVRLR
jgi:predicted dehydrogenase